MFVDCNNTLTLRSALDWNTTALDTTSYHYFLSDKPFIAIKAVLGNSKWIDPCMVTLTDSSRWATTLTFPVFNTSSWGVGTFTFAFVVTVITEESHKDQIRINGESLNVKWNSVGFVFTFVFRSKTNNKQTKSQTKLTGSILKQDPNTNG